ncbi:MAG: bifunctional nuclease family protein [Euryarchaeota archaeon]|nr:bifunctional nuclease family protein [Euryarchaeota archaeon]
MSNFTQVKVTGVFMSGSATPQPVVLLEDGKKRFLPIFIGVAEAFSIQAALSKKISPRPLTHDLVATVLDEIGVKVKQITIDQLKDEIFFARLTIETNGKHKEIDARPSDCIAIALRTSAPIFVAEDVMKVASIAKNLIKDQFEQLNGYA